MVSKRIRLIIGAIITVFRAKSLDAAGQSSVTFGFNTQLPGEMTGIAENQQREAACAY